jgi:hypothetical protein
MIPPWTTDPTRSKASQTAFLKERVLSRGCRPAGATRLACVATDLSSPAGIGARRGRSSRRETGKTRAVKAGRSPPVGEALRARSFSGTSLLWKGPPGPSYSRRCPWPFGVLSRQFPLKAGGLAEPRGPVIPPSRTGDMMRYGRSRLGSSTSPARPEGSHAENELAAGCAGVAHPASARQRISPSRRP